MKILLTTAVGLISLLSGCVGQYVSPDMDCNRRSCYPATGNLLIGRSHRLRAGSTCGLQRPERFCIVSYLEGPKKCFMCDSRRPYSEDNHHSHRIDNIVTERYPGVLHKWWQSENGLVNVSIRLDLEAEFHFTHLIIKFKTFRPAAMLIERSSDFGKTWKTYRYLAYDCAASFPGIPLAPKRHHNDTVCDSAYSNVEPSSGGEVIFRVLPPHLKLEDPYHPDIQDLLRVTNLRVNFTQLHTLGDNLLDNRAEITEKYYYAIYDMIVRGSCQCYGHADRCIPIGHDGVGGYYDNDPRDRASYHPDMVHGRCECTHHTKGLNCEECEDFYNDLPWRPATIKEKNECKRCECNGHASRCHFDRAVYNASGFVSGGVCDDCQHNTMGVRCGMCKPMFYREPGRGISDPYACRPCGCDPKGSENGGICDSETNEDRNLVAGRCRCKTNIQGDMCDRCKNGFWDLSESNPQGCTACTCFLHGTVGNEGCDKYTGACQCKRLVTGENCNQCLPEHWGLGDNPDGCFPCDCDPGGSVNRSRCDILTGQCECKPHFTGRRCDQPESGYFCANVDYFTYEAETTQLDEGNKVEIREPVAGQTQTFTGTGFVRVVEGSEVRFMVDNLAVSMEYNIVIRFESQLRDQWGIRVTVVRPGLPNSHGPCHSSLPRDDFLQASLYPGYTYYEVPQPVCLEAGVRYEINLGFDQYRPGGDPSATLLIDSLVLSPPTKSLSIFQGVDARWWLDDYERFGCRHAVLGLTAVDRLPDECRNFVCPLAAVLMGAGMNCQCDPTGSTSGLCEKDGGQCQCKPNVIGRSCDQCAPGTFGFGPQGCTACECNNIGSLHNFCDLRTGQCKCNDNVYGRRCDQCEPSFWGFPQCQPCQCNGHADVCDQATGACISCRDLTSGHYCDRCQDGYYGDPRLGSTLGPCKPCPCPGGPGSGFQHADSCFLDPVNQNVFCNCRPGYEGLKCEKCAANYFGSPNEIGGSCEKCDCNGNIDYSVEGSCDAATARCLKCLFHSEGFQCENCVAGYFGDATKQTCYKCVCNMLGTNGGADTPCDRVTGQCPCLPNVKGLECDTCEENHWKLASGMGCEHCQCDPNGVDLNYEGQPRLQCNSFDGQCPCKTGRGGRTCSECENYYWGDPKVSCQSCDCNPIGSATLQCNRTTGACVCQKSSGGPKCDTCARGYTGQWPYCEECGECFQNWDVILQELKEKTKRLVDEASSIEETGVTSVFDDKFVEMERSLTQFEEKLKNASLSKKQLETLKMKLNDLRAQLVEAEDWLNKFDERLTRTTSGVDSATSALNQIRSHADKLSKATAQLEQNVTRLKEMDAAGAFNLTQEAYQLSQEAERKANATHVILGQSETARLEAEQILNANKEDFDQQYKDNTAKLKGLEGRLGELEGLLPDVNRQVCGGTTAGGVVPAQQCDDLCGGAGCGTCGGPACGDGAVGKSESALKYAMEANEKLKEKQMKANEVLQSWRQAQNHTESALLEAKKAYEAALRTAQQANKTKTNLEEILKKMQDCLSNNQTGPSEIRNLSMQILGTAISLTPEQIRELADKIQESLGRLTKANIEAILAETRGNLTRAKDLKEKADMAKNKAESVLATTTSVLKALEDSDTAQKTGEAAIADAAKDIKQTEDDLKKMKEATDKAEKISNETGAKLAQLDKTLRNISVGFLDVKKDVDTAGKVIEEASNLTDAATQKLRELQTHYDSARDKMNQRVGSADRPQTRAEELRKRANSVLDETNEKLSKIEKEKKKFESNDNRLNSYATTLTQLHDRIDEYSAAIQERLNYYQTCD